jgi:cytochrome c553
MMRSSCPFFVPMPRWLAAAAIVLAAVIPAAASAATAQPTVGSGIGTATVIPPAVSATGSRVIPDTLAERVAPCMTCHGPQGRSTPSGYFPRIAGKPAGYLYRQLLSFRDGRRINPMMSGLVRNLSDDYLREIADFFAAQDLPYPPPQPAQLAPGILERAGGLVAQGDPARRVPACTRCHGAAMTGVQPDIPGLLGLPRDYLVAQFGAWRNGIRHADAPDCMAKVAKSLSAEDVSAMANWLAAQPLPADPHPAAAIDAPLPLACGVVAGAGGTGGAAAPGSEAASAPGSATR